MRNGAIKGGFRLAPAITCALIAMFSLAAAARAEFNWRKYEGQTIRVILAKSAFTPMNLKQIQEFEKATGIKVVHEHYGSDPLRNKLLMELAAKNKDLDVFQGMMKTNHQYHKAGWLEPLDAYLKDPALTSPDYDYADFYPKILTVIDGQTMGITTSVNTMVLMYRRDLFEQHGVKVPTNWPEMEAAAKKLTLDTDGDKKTDVYGWIARMDAENTAPFANFLFSNGARWLDEKRRPAFNSPEAVEAMKFYGRLLKEYGPIGGSTIGWKEVIGAFAQGKAAMTVEISIFAQMVLEDPKQSKVVGKVGYALFPPAKPQNAMTMVPTNTLHIGSHSEKKEAAWYYIQFMTDKAHMLEAHLNGLHSSRKSSWQDPKWKLADKLPELTRIVLQGFENGLVDFEIPIAGFVEARQHLNQVIFTAYEGGDVKKAADQAVKDVAEIMKRTD
ncbi:MAG: sugar ABC transporter substrate-binding protein [Thermodesulfobacteriota bacterium]